MAEFQKELEVYFYECDPAGVLFFARAGDLFHRTYEAFVQEMGFSWQNWFQNPEWAVPLKKFDIEYFRPVYAGQKYVSKLLVQQMGESSFALHTRIFHGEDIYFQIHSLHVFVDKKSSQKRATPSEVKSALQRYKV